MGVYIKGMKKPKDCNACFLDLYDRQTYCRNGEKALCPLVEVKTPHGRLIDAVEVEAQAELMQKVNGKDRGFMDIALAFAVAPTVIEAEESE